MRRFFGLIAASVNDNPATAMKLIEVTRCIQRGSDGSSPAFGRVRHLRTARSASNIPSTIWVEPSIGWVSAAADSSGNTPMNAEDRLATTSTPIIVGIFHLSMGSTSVVLWGVRAHLGAVRIFHGHHRSLP